MGLSVKFEVQRGEFSLLFMLLYIEKRMHIEFFYKVRNGWDQRSLVLDC